MIDNGVGFDEKYLDRIFQRLHGRSEYAGTGIGLAICEEIVTNHGGAITASSSLDQGATVSVCLIAFSIVTNGKNVPLSLIFYSESHS